MITRGHIHRQAELVLIEAEWAVLQREQYSLGGRWRRWYGRRTFSQKAYAACSVAILLFGWLLVETLNRQDRAMAYQPVKYNDTESFPTSQYDPVVTPQRWQNEAILTQKGTQGGPQGTPEKP